MWLFNLYLYKVRVINFQKNDQYIFQHTIKAKLNRVCLVRHEPKYLDFNVVMTVAKKPVVVRKPILIFP